MMHDLPAFVSHADWGVDAKKRWRAVARLDESGKRYELDGPDPVGTVGSVTERMGGDPSGAATSVLGFDFPIGLPRKYAELADIDHFRSALMILGKGIWREFFDVADSAEQVSLQRPFYPRGSGLRGEHSRQVQLDRLGLVAADMLRRCDRAHEGRGAANPLFWTLGGAQVGKGALRGWSELIVPALHEDPDTVAIWPFDGSLPELMATSRVVIVETYPAEFYAPLGLKFGARGDTGKWGKRQQHDRKAQAMALLSAAGTLEADVSDRLRSEILDGFGSRSDGEDRFDAIVGLLGMLHVLHDRIPEGVPWDDLAVSSVEGWILGRPE